MKTLQALQQAVTPGRQTTLQNRADLADTLGAPADLAAAQRHIEATELSAIGGG
jgi:hypothetical protein